MHPAKWNLRNVRLSGYFTVATAALLLFASFSPSALAQQKGQKTFSSADEACHALVTALKNSDDQALLQILGPDGKEIISSGDPVEDAATRTNFVSKFHQMHRLVVEPDGTTTLYIGAENWPTPIPLVNKNGAFYFNTEAGKQEILYRRIGRNEMSAIRVCQELVAAQNEYFAKENNEYAQKLASDAGKKDGLYWADADKQSQSPIGPLVANASVPNGAPKNLNTPPTPFHGYYFRIVTRQGKDAPGGAADYIVNGKMTGGFAFVAYPAEYRNSGVMTFIVGKDGVVYEKDLGKKTEAAAKSIKSYDPDTSWKKSSGAMQEQSADAKKPQ
ncbi:MAG: DUF2950 domain-containing protein [Candidatus Acidiferrales bacterium]